jgi:hypothetical protein
MNTIPQSLDLAGWLGCFAFLVMLINGALKLADRVRGKSPCPPNEELDADFNGLDLRVARLEAQVEIIRAEMRNDRDALMRAGEERAGKIHDRINALGERLTVAVGELRGEMKRM